MAARKSHKLKDAAAGNAALPGPGDWQADVKAGTPRSRGPLIGQEWRGLAWMAPAVSLIAFIVAYPMGYAVWLSLHEKRALAMNVSWVGVEHYIRELTSSDFWHSVWIGLVYGGLSVVCQLLLGLAAALLLNKEFRGRTPVRALVLLPYLVPTASVALMFAFMFNNLYGIVNRILLSLGIIEEAILFLGDPVWAMPITILVATWKWFPFMVIVLLARLQTVDPELLESARVEGAGRIAVFRDITLPSLRGAIALIVLLRSVWMFNKYDIPYLLTYGGPLGATTNLPIYTYEVMFEQGNQGSGSTLAVLMSLILLVFALIYFRVAKPEREVAVE